MRNAAITETVYIYIYSIIKENIGNISTRKICTFFGV